MDQVGGTMTTKNAAERLLEDLLAAGAIPSIGGGRLAVDAPPGRDDRGAARSAGGEPAGDAGAGGGAVVFPRTVRGAPTVLGEPPCAKPTDGRPCLVPATCCASGESLPPGRRYLCTLRHHRVDPMSRRLWRCQNSACSEPHGTVLGRLNADDSLVLSPAVHTFRVFLDTRRAHVVCPACGTVREFRGSAIFSRPGDG